MSDWFTIALGAYILVGSGIALLLLKDIAKGPRLRAWERVSMLMISLLFWLPILFSIVACELIDKIRGGR